MSEVPHVLLKTHGPHCVQTMTTQLEFPVQNEVEACSFASRNSPDASTSLMFRSRARFDPPYSCSNDFKKCLAAGSAEPGLASFGHFLPAATPASSSFCSSDLPWAAPCKAPSSSCPPLGLQLVHGRCPRQPPPTDRCCNGHSQSHHSVPSWPTKAIGLSIVAIA